MSVLGMEKEPNFVKFNDVYYVAGSVEALVAVQMFIVNELKKAPQEKDLAKEKCKKYDYTHVVWYNK